MYACIYSIYNEHQTNRECAKPTASQPTDQRQVAGAHNLKLMLTVPDPLLHLYSFIIYNSALPLQDILPILMMKNNGQIQGHSQEFASEGDKTGSWGR